MDKIGRPAELAVVVLGEGRLLSVGEIIPCGPSLSSCCREKVTDRDTDYRMLVNGY
jgi:hypothetical protein